MDRPRATRHLTATTVSSTYGGVPERPDQVPQDGGQRPRRAAPGNRARRARTASDRSRDRPSVRITAWRLHRSPQLPHPRVEAGPARAVFASITRCHSGPGTISWTLQVTEHLLPPQQLEMLIEQLARGRVL